MILLRYFRLLSKHEPPAVSRAVINIVILTEAATQGGHCLAHLVGVVPLHLQLLVLCSGRQRKHGRRTERAGGLGASGSPEASERFVALLDRGGFQAAAEREIIGVLERRDRRLLL